MILIVKKKSHEQANFLNRFYFPVLFFILIQPYISNVMFFFLSTLDLLFHLLTHKKNLFQIIRNSYIQFLFCFLLFGTIIGVINFYSNNISIRDFFRDFYYHLSPIILISLACCYAKEKIDINRIFYSIILGATILSSIYIFSALPSLSLLLSSSSANAWRSISGNGLIISTIAIPLLLFSSKWDNQKKPFLGFKWLALLICSAYFMISLSRTNLIIMIIVLICFLFSKKNHILIIKCLFAFLLFIIAFLLILPRAVTTNYIQKILASLTEISPLNNWANQSTIQSNWRGYETYCAIQEWKGYDFVSKIIGKGFGKRIFVGDLSVLVDENSNKGVEAGTIPVLHNGYSTMLVKLGILGVLLYLAYYLKLIKFSISMAKKSKNINAFYYRLLLGVSLSLTIMTVFLNGLFKENSFYPLLLIIGIFSSKSFQKKKIVILPTRPLRLLSGHL